MYEEHWELARKPFEDTIDDDLYYPSAPHQGAILKLRYAVENKRGAAVVTGVAGVGKSLLIQNLFTKLDDEYSPRTHIVFPQFTSDQLISYLAAEICHKSAQQLQENVRTLGDFLIENGSAGKHAVLAIDEAHLLGDPESLEALRLLLNFEHEGERCLTLILIGQPQILAYLNRCPGLDDRVAVKSLLRPFSQAETIEYIEHRLRAAGANRPIFDEAARAAVFQFSGGIPRRINRLCDLALLIGFAEQHSEIGPQQIKSVADEIVSVRPEAA